MPIIITGFLLNTIITFTDPANRHDRRQYAKIGYVDRCR